jgi:hypothetical protein
VIDEDMLHNGYPSLLILDNDNDSCQKHLGNPMSPLKKNEPSDHHDNINGIGILSNCSHDSISEASDSYEMVEYGLNPYEVEALKMSRRKSCLCWHPDVIFNEREDSESMDTFPEDFMARLDQYDLDSEVYYVCIYPSNFHCIDNNFRKFLWLIS